MSKKLVIATHNLKKAGEMVTILSRSLPGWEIVTLADYPGSPEPEETGTTYAENAAIKAESGCAYTGEWSLADDAGLEIDALPGELGVYSKGFAGDETPFPEKIQEVLRRMERVPDGERSARFNCHIALARPNQPTLHLSAQFEGLIAPEPRGSGGFGYDPIFYIPQMGRTMAELTADEKHAVSHRGQVLRQFIDWIRHESN